MSFSLGLTLYALRRRAPDAPAAPPPPPRPEGTLVWLHAPAGELVPPMLVLARRLIAEDGVSVLLTGSALHPGAPASPRDRPVNALQPQGAGLLTAAPPADTAAEARAFLDHWRPAAGVMAGGEVRPALIDQAAQRGLPLALVDAERPALPPGRDGWFPGLMRGALARLDHVMPVDETAARALRRAGVRAAALHAGGRMEHPSSTLPITEAERAALSRLMATRPVWLASHIPEAEEAVVIEAHRSVLRLAHRMLMIVVPDDPARAPAMAARMAEVEGWMVARRSADEEPEPDVQVYLADGPGELGLWYRLAPVTYMGGSLTAGGCVADPLAAAAVGSAIVHGPRSGAHGGAIGRLAAAQATALVGSAADLALTLGELLAPDRAARLAQAAWLVTTEGAEVTARALALVRAMIAGRG